jgi:hypothetical protein
MAWRTKDGRTSDRQLEAAARRGTEPKTGIRESKAERAKVQASMDRVGRQAAALRRGDFHAAFYED